MKNKAILTNTTPTNNQKVVTVKVTKRNLKPRQHHINPKTPKPRESESGAVL